MTQQQLALAAGVSMSTICSIERGASRGSKFIKRAIDDAIRNSAKTERTIEAMETARRGVYTEINSADVVCYRGASLILRSVAHAVADHAG
jgi:DNA-binding XRE family transcriptional regulator